MTTSRVQPGLVRRIEAFATPNTLTPTLAPDLVVYAWSTGPRAMHLVYRPSLCVVLRGRKTARVEGRSYAYDPRTYFFTAVPLPAKLTVRRAEGAVVGLVLELDLEVVARIALEIDDIEPGSRRRSSADAIASTGRITPRMLDVLGRLVDAATDPLRHAVLYAATLREAVFELLVGPQGEALRRAVHHQGRLRPVVDVLRYLDAHSHEAIRMPVLARRAGMSESSFFIHFRRATGATPLQYLKRLRLTKARMLLASGTYSVTDVALRVGYCAPSQFARDFKRAFGCVPSALTPDPDPDDA